MRATENIKVGDRVREVSNNIDLKAISNKIGVVKQIMTPKTGFDYSVEFKDGHLIWCNVKAINTRKKKEK
jgi:hypothetical protein